MHRGKLGTKTENCVIVESLETFRGQTVGEMMAGEIEYAEGRRFRRSRTRKSAEIFYYGREFREDEVMEYPVLEELELTAKKMVG